VTPDRRPDRPPAGGPPALVLDDVTVTYGPVVALEAATGEVAPGQSVALIGPNGAGKSTLIRAVLGLVPLAAGRIEVLGADPVAARRDVGYVPQADLLDLDFPVTVLQVVLMGRYRRIGWLRRPGRADRERAREALAEVGLADRADRRFGELSGGQRQRVLLARALAADPRLLLLDEPFNGVDSVSQELLLDALSRARAGGAAVLISTHDLALAHLACDEVCLLNRHQVGFGPTAATLTPELLQRTYGGRAIELSGHAIVVAPS
jgi:manganese/iron transport system ATP-binding protein